MSAVLRNKGSAQPIDLEDPGTPITLIADKFREFQNQCIPLAASEMQVSEMRRAFYAGAAAVGYVIKDAFEDGLPPEETAKILPAIEVEVNRYGSQLLQNAAGKRKKH